MVKIKHNNLEKGKKIIPGGNMLLSKRPEIFYQINGQHISVPKVVWSLI